MGKVGEMPNCDLWVPQSLGVWQDLSCWEQEVAKEWGVGGGSAKRGGGELAGSSGLTWPPGTHLSHTCQIGSSFMFLSDAKDPDQLGRNKITHIISIHESPQPLLQVLLTPIPGLCIEEEGSF